MIYLLSGKKGYERKRNKRKDIYESFSLTNKAQDWKYCIEGCDINHNKLRIMMTFTEDLMPIITENSVAEHIMNTKKVKHYYYDGFGFPVELDEVEMIFIAGN